MHGTRSSRTPARSTLRRADTVTWIDRRRAFVARLTPHGAVEIDEFPLPAEEPGRILAIAAVAHAIGDRERIVVLGPESSRIALERELVSIFRRPDRLVDQESNGPVGPAALVALLREQGA
jgi:hypothetical protein